MKKKNNQLRLNKKQISILNQSAITGGRPSGFSRQCPVETVNITRCYGANQCQKWPRQD
ncbi:hypothetical protein U8527_05890 [Kordia algicida OT-1]|uniref:Uncharacterized protein n=1 Tax=Kordia algicida OT-1 TaxID=391587 RepID=A9E0X7_9FLAO|nr:hypothetical protein [Kordia algicida]EDP95555.1 hypothetical protein KAOT1_21926 [Kordia algicida OT-1]